MYEGRRAAERAGRSLVCGESADHSLMIHAGTARERKVSRTAHGCRWGIRGRGTRETLLVSAPKNSAGAENDGAPSPRVDRSPSINCEYDTRKAHDSVWLKIPETELLRLPNFSLSCLCVEKNI